MAQLLRSFASTAGAAVKFPALAFNKVSKIRRSPSRASNGDSFQVRLNSGLGCSFNIQRSFTSGVNFSSSSANGAPAENRSDRAKKALGFTKSSDYTFLVGRKSVFSNGHHSFLWSERCFHLTWVAVHGPESICLVTWFQDLDVSRLLPAFRNNCTAECAMCSFGETVISEVECLLHFDADYNDDDLRMHSRGKNTPFAVVSVVADNERVPKGNLREDYDIDKAFNFWQGKMKSGLASSVDETILTSISGFQHLCPKDLNAEDIWVTVLTPSNGEMMHLHLEKRREYLAVMKSGGSSAGLGVSSEVAPPIVSANPPVWVYKTNLPKPDLMKEFRLDAALEELKARNAFRD